MADRKAEFMAQAIALALRAAKSGKGGPFGALIVRDDIVVAEGCNLVTSRHDPTAHAEIIAIRLGCAALKTFQLKGCEIYASCEPCPMCLGAIYWARLDGIYFAATRKNAADAGFDDDFIYKEFAKASNNRKLPIEQVTLPDAIQPFKEWRAKADKTLY